MPDAASMKSRTLRNELLSELGVASPSRRHRKNAGDDHYPEAIAQNSNKKPLKSILRNKTSTNSTPDLWSLDQDCYKNYCGPRPVNHKSRPNRRTDKSPTPPTRRSSMESSNITMRRIASAPDDLSMSTIHCPKARAVVVVVSPSKTARQDVAPRAPLRRSSVHQ